MGLESEDGSGVAEDEVECVEPAGVESDLEGVEGSEVVAVEEVELCELSGDDDEEEEVVWLREETGGALETRGDVDDDVDGPFTFAAQAVELSRPFNGLVEEGADETCLEEEEDEVILEGNDEVVFVWGLILETFGEVAISAVLLGRLSTVADKLVVPAATRTTLLGMVCGLGVEVVVLSIFRRAS